MVLKSLRLGYDRADTINNAQALDTSAEANGKGLDRKRSVDKLCPGDML
jgi:hypothetical protein